jgi:hypothetical protein
MAQILKARKLASVHVYHQEMCKKCSKRFLKASFKKLKK